MKRIRKRHCRHCSIFFIPDHRNADRQDYCGLPECRKASKTASQAKWLAKNPSYFKGPDHVERVREWRQANPGYRHRQTSSDMLQDDCQRKITQKQDIAQQLPLVGNNPAPVLQDPCLAQHPVFIGLIAHLLGLVLQDDIVAAINRLTQSGVTR